MQSNRNSSITGRALATVLALVILLAGCWILRLPHAIAAVVGLLDLLLLFDLGRGVRRAIASRHWPTVEPTSFRSFIVETQDVESGSDHEQLKAEYRYEVEGREYNGRRLSFPFNSTGAFASTYRKQARELNQPGQALVHYDPRDPALSVIRPGLAVVDAAGVLLAGLALVGVLALLGLYLAGRLV